MKKYLRIICWLFRHPVEDPEGYFVQVQNGGRKNRPVRLGKLGLATCRRCGMLLVLNESNYRRIVAV